MRTALTSNTHHLDDGVLPCCALDGSSCRSMCTSPVDGSVLSKRRPAILRLRGGQAEEARAWHLGVSHMWQLRHSHPAHPGGGVSWHPQHKWSLELQCSRPTTSLFSGSGCQDTRVPATCSRSSEIVGTSHTVYLLQITINLPIYPR